MAWFKRKKEREPECIHSWFLADFETVISNLAIDVAVDNYYVLCCQKCGDKRSVNKFDFAKMQRLGLIKGA